MNPAGDTARRKWSLTREAFDSLLASLGPDRDTAAGRYLEIRRNLVRLFEWRGSPAPDEDADETLNRCARKIADGEEIRDVSTYAIGVARMLVREKVRERAREPQFLHDGVEPRIMPAETDDLERREECLRRCLIQLSSEDREVILSYYRGEKGEKIRNRKQLTRQFGIPPSTLRMRALRLREKLQACTLNCLERRPGNSVDKLFDPRSTL